MFQDFEECASPVHGAERIASLRTAMAADNLDLWLVPHADEHQSEYLPANAERLSWLTGFTGSAGYCFVSAQDAVILIDGRYTLQVRNQTDAAVFSYGDLVETPPHKWLAQTATSDMRIGFDPWLTPIGMLRKFEKAAKDAGARLVACENLIDAIWTDRPGPPLGPVVVHPLDHAGKAASEKLAELDAALTQKSADLCILSDPSSLAWTFNIRGADVAHTPLPFGYALLRQGQRPLLFMDRRKLDNATSAYLEGLTELAEPTELVERLKQESAGRSVMCDPALVPSALLSAITEAEGNVIEARDPATLPRAIKNTAEIDGTRAAHHRDGVAFVRFLAWLSRQQPAALDEITAASKLEELRAKTATEMGSELKDIAFDSISGSAANGAIVHYRVTRATNAPFEPNSLYLVDSGGQYVDGTTDITRTIAIGTPPAPAVEDFTLVLKGHIAFAMARFPAGTTGRDLDTLARMALWRRAKDYAHGTGHGVGSYLSVHEGPQSISRRGTEPLRGGMIVSNEPGFYRAGEYGIRIENLVLVSEAETFDGGTIAVHDFETLTLAPIDRTLIDASLLTDEEVTWLDAYHERVAKALSPHLDDEDRQWLTQACAPISR